MRVEELGRSAVTAPILAAGPDGPWRRVRESVALSGHAVVCTDWRGWLSAASSGPSLRALLGPRDWQRYHALAKPEVRCRFAVSRMLVGYAAGAALEVPPESVELAYQAGGRPYLRGCDQLDVSLSHTLDLVAVGINRRGRIGVDTELRRRRLRYSEVHRQMCTAAEQVVLAGLSASEQERELLRLWTLKEAYTKALGQGMRLGFTQFGFDEDGQGPLAPDGAPASFGEWSFGTFGLTGEDRYLVSVACQDAGHGRQPETAVRTALDEGLSRQVVALLNRSPGHRR